MRHAVRLCISNSVIVAAPVLLASVRGETQTDPLLDPFLQGTLETLGGEWEGSVSTELSSSGSSWAIP